jgi:hypothetical protein
MAKYTSGEFQQYHQGDREYCRESGPLNHKAASFPPVLHRNGLGLVSSVAMILVSTLLLLPLLLTSRVTNIGTTDAWIRVDIQNRPADQVIRYVLSPAADPELTMAQGILEGDTQILTFHQLTPDTDYLICYYTDEEGTASRIGQLLFRTLPDPTEPTAPSTEPIVPPAESTEPPTVPTEPPTEPTEPPTVPTEPPTEPTEPPTVPTEPPTEPTEPPTVPTEPISTPRAETPEITGALAVTDLYGDTLQGYRVSETHIFTGVPSGSNTITVTQAGSPLSDYTVVYDAAAETLTVSFTGRTIAPGSTAASRVSLTCEDGGTASSTQSVTTPGLDSLTVTPTVNGDGTVTFRMDGTLTQPSTGSILLTLALYPDRDGTSGDSNLMGEKIFSPDTGSAAFSQSVTLAADHPGLTMTAQALAYAHWSLEAEDAVFEQRRSAEQSYRIPDISQLTFEEVTEISYGFIYTVKAKFANLLNCTPISVEFFRETYSWYWDENYGEESMGTVTGLTIDETGALYALFAIDEDDLVPREQDGHRWRAVLTYRDGSGAEKTAELVSSMEPLCSHFNNFESNLWQSGGRYYMDYTFYTFMNPNLNPGDVVFGWADSDGWTVESATAHRDGDLLTVTGRMSTDHFFTVGFNTYWKWTAAEDYIVYSGCGTGSVCRFNNQLLSATPEENGTGFTDVTETHTFIDGAGIHSPEWGHIGRIRVTLADGTVINLAYGETDPTGRVSVNWADGSDITVTITQPQVSAGSHCTVELIVNRFWENSGDRNITATDITRSTLYY